MYAACHNRQWKQLCASRDYGISIDICAECAHVNRGADTFAAVRHTCPLAGDVYQFIKSRTAHFKCTPTHHLLVRLTDSRRRAPSRGAPNKKKSDCLHFSDVQLISRAHSMEVKSFTACTVPHQVLRGREVTLLGQVNEHTQTHTHNTYTLSNPQAKNARTQPLN